MTEFENILFKASFVQDVVKVALNTSIYLDFFNAASQQLYSTLNFPYLPTKLSIKNVLSHKL